MFQTEKFDLDADSFSETSDSTLSDSDNDSDDIAGGITFVTVDGKAIDLSQGPSNTTVIQAPGLRNIQIGKGRCTIVGTSDHKHGRGSRPKKSEKSPPRHRAPKLSDSKHPPSKDDLSHVCTNIGRHWRKLALSLGLSRPVDCIEEDFRHEGSYEMAWQSLLRWRRQHGDGATLGELVQALDDIGHTELASELPV